MRTLFQFTCILTATLLLWACQRAPQTAPAPSAESPELRWAGLFEAVQEARIFPDSKTFADCTPRYADARILSAWREGRGNAGFDLKAFVMEHFELPKAFASGFQADTSRSISAHIDSLWPVLTRQPEAQHAGTLLALPKPYVVPGGRFGEIYYWDSYFTMLGLQASGKTELIRNMTDNFAYLIETYGHIPNGNRSYYLSRSQPPFFALMAELSTNGDEKALAAYSPALEKEYAFWAKRFSKTPQGHLLCHYDDARSAPRAESWREDRELVARNGGDTSLYRQLRAACESGWDFSSRWFSDGKTLDSVRTLDIAPVDLMCLLYEHARVNAAAARAAGNAARVAYYEGQMNEWRRSVQELCWDESRGWFMDFDMKRGKVTGIRSLAGMYPLFSGLATAPQAASAAQVLEKDFLQAGGLVTTLEATGQQWDWPNGWAPLQWIAIKGLRHYGHNELASDIRQRWIALNTRVYKSTGKMLEKYNVADMSLTAGGGEYPVQDGFGWSNGVLKKLLSEDVRSNKKSQ